MPWLRPCYLWNLLAQNPPGPLLALSFLVILLLLHVWFSGYLSESNQRLFYGGCVLGLASGLTLLAPWPRSWAEPLALFLGLVRFWLGLVLPRGFPWPFFYYVLALTVLVWTPFWLGYALLPALAGLFFLIQSQSLGRPGLGREYGALLQLSLVYFSLLRGLQGPLLVSDLPAWAFWRYLLSILLVLGLVLVYVLGPSLLERWSFVAIRELKDWYCNGPALGAALELCLDLCSRYPALGLEVRFFCRALLPVLTLAVGLYGLWFRRDLAYFLRMLPLSLVSGLFGLAWQVFQDYVQDQANLRFSWFLFHYPGRILEHSQDYPWSEEPLGVTISARGQAEGIDYLTAPLYLDLCRQALAVRALLQRPGVHFWPTLLRLVFWSVLCVLLEPGGPGGAAVLRCGFPGHPSP